MSISDKSGDNHEGKGLRLSRVLLRLDSIPREFLESEFSDCYVFGNSGEQEFVMDDEPYILYSRTWGPNAYSFLKIPQAWSVFRRDSKIYFKKFKELDITDCVIDRLEEITTGIEEHYEGWKPKRQHVTDHIQDAMPKTGKNELIIMEGQNRLRSAIEVYEVSQR